MLTDADIKRHGLIRRGKAENYRSSSYDLTIGQMIDPDGEIVSRYKLPAQGIVEVISEEEVRLPSAIAGMAMVKTRLCQEGILALSIGIIDPCFEGRISSFMINFGREPKLLQRGEVFLRTTFQPLSGEPDNTAAFKQNYSEMIRERRRMSVERFDATFLSVDSVASKSAEKVVTDYRNKALVYVGATALLLAFLTFLVNFSTIWLKWPDGPVATVTRTPAGTVEVRELMKQNADLRGRIDALERRVPAGANRGTR